MRGLPFFKPKNKPQFAGLNFSDTSSGGGGGGGGGSTNNFEYKLNVETLTNMKYLEKDVYSLVVDDARFHNMGTTFTNVTVPGKIPSEIETIVDCQFVTNDKNTVSGGFITYYSDGLLYARLISGSMGLTYNVNNKVLLLYTKVS